MTPATRSALATAILLTALSGPGRVAAAPAADVETIVLLRHGEKPALGFGQLDCQGLNRALALPAVIGREFGRPTAIFAPDPAKPKDDNDRLYDYIRPLATIEPTAIGLGLPVDVSIGFSDVAALEQRLDGADYRSGLVLVAWEHHYIVTVARMLMAQHGGDPASVPDWKGDDFDSIYVLRITRADGRETAAFERHQEGLDGQSKACPWNAPK